MTTQTVSAVDVSLFHVAAQYLGDATQWWRIAQVNGMSDPDLTWLSAPIQIDIPIASPALTGGTPPTDGT